jgi:hypothetical protein
LHLPQLQTVEALLSDGEASAEVIDMRVNESVTADTFPVAVSPSSRLTSSSRILRLKTVLPVAVEYLVAGLAG